MFREQHFLFKGWVWKPHQISLELIENINLWSVTIQTEESFHSDKNPDEIFLLQAVEHIIVGKTLI